MINFLLLIDRSGLIQETKWSNPAYIVSMQNRTIFDIFDPQSHDLLRQKITECLQTSSLLHCADDMSLTGHEEAIGMCLLPVDKKILFFAAETSLAQNSREKKELQQIIHSFMSVIKGYTQEIVFHKNEASRFHFEKIQGLNNELINTKRQLEKANTQLNQLNRQLNNRLVSDALTGLVSRYQYHTEMKQLIASDPDKKGIFTFIDIDNFKSINDNYGHAVGDAYLIEFAGRLKKLPIEKTIKMRISGDEFGLFSYGLDSVDDKDIESLWQKIKQTVLKSQIIVEEQLLPLSISAGMSVYGDDTIEIYDLIDFADFAMYKAKQGGRNGYRRFCRSEYEKARNEK